MTDSHQESRLTAAGLENATEYLEAVKARAETATEGPWGIDDFGDLKGPDDGQIFEGDTWGGGASASAGDTAFIAHARQDVPALVAALEAALERCDKWEADLDDDREGGDYESGLDDGAGIAAEAIRRTINEHLGGEHE